MTALPESTSPSSEKRTGVDLLVGFCQAAVAAFGRWPVTADPDEVEFTFEYEPDERFDMICTCHGQAASGSPEGGAT